MSDLDALVAIENAAFVGDRLSPRSFRHLLRSHSCSVVVAEMGGSVLGYALVLFRKASRRARLYSIAVDSTAHAAGVGRALLAAAERSARERGATQMRLEVREDNARAVPFYEKAGYRRFGVKPGYYADGATALRYAKPLQEGHPRA